MLARPSDSYKYYLEKIRVATYMDEVCLAKLFFFFFHVRNFKEPDKNELTTHRHAFPHT